MAYANPLGRFVWHELMTPDPDAAIEFYPAVTGWGVLPYDLDPSYRMWTVDGVPLGGVLPIPDEAKAMGAVPYWLPYVGTADLAATLSHAVRLGATMYVPPTEIPVGTFSVLRDPQGATFALFQAAAAVPGHEGEAGEGEFSWHELRTTDGAAAWKFYRALFGWDETGAMDMGPDGIYQMFGRNGVELGGMYKSENVPPSWLSYVRVPGTDAAIAHATRLGGAVANGPMAVPGGNYIAEMRDVHGVAFALHEERETVVVAPGREVKPTARPKAKSKAKAKAKNKAKAKPSAKTKAKPKAKPKSKPKAKPKSKAKAKPKSTPNAKPKARKPVKRKRR
jgi:predicted enzyme related to lactoylglutathione lyase